MEPIYLNINDASTFTSMSRTSLYEAMKKGTLTAKKAGRRTLLSVAELRAYLENLPSMGN